MTTMIRSALLASTDPERLRRWYQEATGAGPDTDGFLDYRTLGVLVDLRDDVAPRAAEPARLILNYHVTDIHSVAARLEKMGAPWVAAVEYRDAGLWFGTVEDPDGNYVQFIETTPDYWVQKLARAGAATGPLTGASLAVRLPAQDLERARRFYADKLGLEPVDEREGGLLYEAGGQEFAVFASSGRASGDHTQLGFVVPDLDVTVRALRDRGVTFEEYDFGDLPVTDGVVEFDGYYPSRGAVGERTVWFHDSECNLLAISQLVHD